MEILVFELPGCPYCRRGRKLVSELSEELSLKDRVTFRYVDETAEKALSDAHDYYYCPSWFLNGRKIYEEDPSRSEDAARGLMRCVLKDL